MVRVTSPSATPPSPPSLPPDEGAGKPLPLQLELPSEIAPRGTRDDRPEAGRPERPRVALGARVVRVLAALLLLVGGAALAGSWLIPWYVKRQCVDLAAAHGVTLAVEDIKIAPDGFRLLGVRAVAAVIPGARAEAPQVDVVTHGLRPDTMTVRGAELAVQGRPATLGAAFAKWRASPRGGEAGAWAPKTLVLDGAHLLWRSPIGDDARVEASELHVALGWSEHGEELHARSDRVTLQLTGTPFGPWRLDYDRVPDGSRLRWALDPGVPEASTVLVVSDAERTTSVDVVIPRSPIDHLGLPADFIGPAAIPSAGLGDATLAPPPQVELALHYVALGPARADASAKGGIYGAHVPGLPRAVDVAWQGTASGIPGTGIEVKKAQLAVGPLVGAVTGTLQAFEDGFRLDLAWAAAPVPCAALLASLDPGQPFHVDYQLRRLATTALAKKLLGQVSASVMVSFDSRDLTTGKIDFRPEVDCRPGAP
jgi:hypothetical protein